MRIPGAAIFTGPLEDPSLAENGPHRRCQADLLVDLPHIPSHGN
jgi:hypothetical protein